MNVEAPRLPPVGNQSPVHSTSSHPVITAGSIPLLQGCDLDKDVTSLSKSSQCLNRPVIITGPRPLGALPPPGAPGALSLPTTGTPSQARTGSGIPPPPPPPDTDFLLSGNFPPVSSKLVQRIRRWEFIELNQLLPDNLVAIPTDPTDSDKKGKAKQLPPIQDVHSWAIVMAVYTAIINTHKTAELLVYTANILQTSITYPADACLAYDRVFRAQAHLKPTFDWASDNSKTSFRAGGRANPKPCTKCGSTLHLSLACPKDDRYEDHPLRTIKKQPPQARVQRSPERHAWGSTATGAPSSTALGNTNATGAGVPWRAAQRHVPSSTEENREQASAQGCPRWPSSRHNVTASITKVFITHCIIILIS